MNPEIKKKWIDALRSGEYKQGKHRLGAPNGQGNEYCCLGVLCELAVKAGIIAPPVIEEGEWLVYAGSPTYLPKEVSDWAGITNILKTHEVAEINDHSDTFAEVIPFIEDNF